MTGLGPQVQSAVSLFWRLAGETEAFPRSLERPLALALPVALVKMPRLQLRGVEAWLRQRGTPYRFGCESRDIRGCLVAHAGKGLLFVDGADPDDERRFTVAHEIAHFLVDYWLPREKVIEKLGPKLADVIDGLRPPTVTERVHAMLGSLRIGPYQSLMERGEQVDLSDVWNAENRADQIGLALLAPPDEIFSRVDLTAMHHTQRLSGMMDVLRGQFGLPAELAAEYGRILLTAAGKGPSWVESLGLR